MKNICCEVFSKSPIQYGVGEVLYTITYVQIKTYDLKSYFAATISNDLIRHVTCISQVT
jgi:hypothetical protein